MDAATLKKVLSESKLTQVELATLYGVSRQTIHTWLTASLPREGSYTARMAKVITTALLNALEKKILPFAAVKKEVRADRISRMAKMLQSLKPAPAKI